MNKFRDLFLGIMLFICGLLTSYIGILALYMGFWWTITLFISGTITGVKGLEMLTMSK